MGWGEMGRETVVSPHLPHNLPPLHRLSHPPLRLPGGPGCGSVAWAPCQEPPEEAADVTVPGWGHPQHPPMDRGWGGGGRSQPAPPPASTAAGHRHRQRIPAVGMSRLPGSPSGSVVGGRGGMHWSGGVVGAGDCPLPRRSTSEAIFYMGWVNGVVVPPTSVTLGEAPMAGGTGLVLWDVPRVGGGGGEAIPARGAGGQLSPLPPTPVPQAPGVSRSQGQICSGLV